MGERPTRPPIALSPDPTASDRSVEMIARTVGSSGRVPDAESHELPCERQSTPIRRAPPSTIGRPAKRSPRTARDDLEPSDARDDNQPSQRRRQTAASTRRSASRWTSRQVPRGRGAARRGEAAAARGDSEMLAQTRLAGLEQARSPRGVRLFWRDLDGQDGSGQISRNHGTFGSRRSLWSSEKRVNSSSRPGGHATSGLGRGSRPVKTRGNRALCPPDRPQLRGFCLTPEEPHPPARRLIKATAIRRNGALVLPPTSSRLARRCVTAALPIGHPGCCLDRRRERALLCQPPVRRAISGPAPLGGGEVPTSGNRT